MAPQSILVLGVMSGTSADGIDVALARISGAPPHLDAKLLGHAASSFPASLRKEILRVAEQRPISAGELSQLNFRLGEVFAEAALAACRSFRISPRRVALIGSHGQTIFHQGLPVAFLGRATVSTLQIGEPAVIAARTGITTVGDFRPSDMAQGGQGAPLVPFADYLLYRDDKVGRVSLNLGGIANVTVIPAGATPHNAVAFDTGPANILIDALVAHFTRGRHRFDKDARIARKGRSMPALVDELMRDPYLRIKPPKSTGREYYGHAYIRRVLALGRKHHAKPADLIRAATIFTALSVVDALNRFIFPEAKIGQLIVSGGGASNPLILAQLSSALSGDASRKVASVQVVRSSALGVPEDAKEAFAFALMAYETFHHRPSNLPSATGARGPAILGKISFAPPR